MQELQRRSASDCMYLVRVSENRKSEDVVYALTDGRRNVSHQEVRNQCCSPRCVHRDEACQ